ncbi:MAG TPA: TetR/AcrR family transcriptional regulator [Gemmatimonadales bacterium]|nr:TetR/AcrR family transcriptional regulator [Gemmatimonadales bacterium]
MNDASVTRGRILKAARKLFADKGFSGASIREITASAGANLGAVTYHFGSKDKLYFEVMDTLADQLASRIERAAAEAATPADAMRAAIAAEFEFFTEAPDVPALLMHQVSTGAQAPPPAIARHMRRILAVFARVVRSGVEQGGFRPMDPVLITFTVVSQSAWFALVGRFIGPVAFPGQDHAAVARRIQAHITDVVCRALQSEDLNA